MLHCLLCSMLKTQLSLFLLRRNPSIYRKIAYIYDQIQANELKIKATQYSLCWLNTGIIIIPVLSIPCKKLAHCTVKIERKFRGIVIAHCLGEIAAEFEQNLISNFQQNKAGYIILSMHLFSLN